MVSVTFLKVCCQSDVRTSLCWILCNKPSLLLLLLLLLTCTSKSGAFRLPDFSVDSDSAGLSMEFSFGDSGTRVTLSLRKGESFASD